MSDVIAQCVFPSLQVTRDLSGMGLHGECALKRCHAAVRCVCCLQQSEVLEGGSRAPPAHLEQVSPDRWAS